VEKTSEMVVLVDDDGNDVGRAPKAEVHTADTPLHRAFSIHLFNTRGEVLITRRALEKKTWPGVWTNAVCGHPGPGEDTVEAIVRRVSDEIGVTPRNITVALPDFRYRAVDASGIVENEICPVFTGIVDTDPTPDPSEVCEWQWVAPQSVVQAITATPFAFSPWLVWQVSAWPGVYRSE
jgi:isopentenyl-diphosphate Delta-isomerase